jgi:hypothetical protein
MPVFLRCDTQEAQDEVSSPQLGEYNRALVQRGSLMLWITEDVLQTWSEGV